MEWNLLQLVLVIDIIFLNLDLLQDQFTRVACTYNLILFCNSFKHFQTNYATMQTENASIQINNEEYILLIIIIVMASSSS